MAGVPLAGELLAILRRVATGPHRLDETLQAKIVVALAATGQQAAAMELVDSLRSRLAKELGVDPGSELRAAHAQVLRQTPHTPPVTVRSDVGAHPAAVTLRPAQPPPT
ncbi:BTAD domain-containing putative transcriptional regulator [Streptomyces sp. NPDC006649]|uniref:AfsR/SARP family transcriptional regulator n=1 Tax=Streptomyces sp. NPDC006649 TaxID=3156896 RepID=UPI0033B86955